MFTEMRNPKEHLLKEHDKIYKSWAIKLMRQGKLIGFLTETSNKQVVASGCIWIKNEQPSPEFTECEIPYLLSMYTEPAFRHFGLGSRIVKEATNWCRKHGYKRFSLHASKMGRKLYKKLGWKRTWEMMIKF